VSWTTILTSSDSFTAFVRMMVVFEALPALESIRQDGMMIAFAFLHQVKILSFLLARKQSSYYPVLLDSISMDQSFTTALLSSGYCKLMLLNPEPGRQCSIGGR
jgi:hypothetical protein